MNTECLVCRFDSGGNYSFSIDLPKKFCTEADVKWMGITAKSWHRSDWTSVEKQYHVNSAFAS